jgi:hypothetical protein
VSSVAPPLPLAEVGEARTSRRRLSVTPLTRTILLGWLLAAVILCLVSAQRIATLAFSDPDDAMRLTEVRDLLAGQSWWDVAQHRLNGGAFAMHWSRLVDLPIAAVMRVCDPLFGSATATRIALVAVPLATLLVVMTLAATLTRRVASEAAAKQAVLLAALSVPLVYQLQPLRIDHHGWQVAAALGAVVALLGRSTPRSGVMAGACLATLVTVSLEGLPIAAAITGAAAIGWVFDDTRRAQALALVAALLGGTILLHGATRGPGMLAPACDAIAPVWIAALTLACGGAAATMLANPRGIALRLGGLALSGVAGAAAIRLGAPICTAGPFATLDPLVYRFWYLNVSEGRPIWDQTASLALMTIGLPISGLVGGVWAWREATGEARTRWTLLLLIATAAFALSILIARAGATANALALPGAAWLLDRLLTRARRVENVGRRTLATAAALLAATLGLATGALLGKPAGGGMGSTAPAPGQSAGACVPARDIPTLAALPSATLFAPLDITPAVLATTDHRAIASGYHRNTAAIHRVIATFLASPDAARQAVAASGARYVVGCAGSNETELYRRWAPNGFWTRLERGERFDWLQPVAIPGSHLSVWRVTDAKRLS